MKVDKLKIEEALSEYEGPRGWEECYGVDHPDFLPYWIIYMPKDERARYLVEAGREFKDFKTEMLDKNFDWSKWENTIPDTGYICVPEWIKHIEPEQRIEYLKKNSDWLSDYSDEMLSPDYNWEEWHSLRTNYENA